MLCNVTVLLLNHLTPLLLSRIRSYQCVGEGGTGEEEKRKCIYGGRGVGWSDAEPW